MKLKGILFDFDGTLGNTTDLILKSFHATIEHFQAGPVEDRDIIATFGLPLTEGLHRLVPKIPTDQLVSFYHEHNVHNHDALIKPFPYVEQGLKELYAKHYKLAVVTSKRTFLANRGLEQLHLAEYMSAVITSEDCVEHKPLPEPMERGAAALQLTPQECLCVGDSPFDLLSGKAAGCVTVLVNWTSYEDSQVMDLVVPDYRIDKLTDLVALMKKI